MIRLNLGRDYLKYHPIVNSLISTPSVQALGVHLTHRGLGDFNLILGR